MWPQALMILASALLSSFLTLALAFYYFDRHYKKRLLGEIDQRAEVYRRRIQHVLDQEIESAGKAIETRVRRGVLDAVASLPSTEVIQGTTQNVVKTGVDLVEAGLSKFLGAKPGKS